MTKFQRSISLDEKIWAEIDRNRGDVSRSRFLATIVAEAMNASKKGEEQSKKVQQPIEEKLQ